MVGKRGAPRQILRVAGEVKHLVVVEGVVLVRIREAAVPQRVAVQLDQGHVLEVGRGRTALARGAQKRAERLLGHYSRGDVELGSHLPHGILIGKHAVLEGLRNALDCAQELGI